MGRLTATAGKAVVTETVSLWANAQVCLIAENITIHHGWAARVFPVIKHNIDTEQALDKDPKNPEFPMYI